MTTEADLVTGEAVPDHHAEAVISALQTQADAIRQRQVEKATAKLATQGTLPASRRAAIRALAANLTDGLLAAPSHTSGRPPRRTTGRRSRRPPGSSTWSKATSAPYHRMSGEPTDE